MTRKAEISDSAVQSRGYYESSSRQLKNEGEKFFSALRAERSALRASMHCLRQWPDHSKIARAGTENSSHLMTRMIVKLVDRDRSK